MLPVKRRESRFNEFALNCTGFRRAFTFEALLPPSVLAVQKLVDFFDGTCQGPSAILRPDLLIPFLGLASLLI
ncbi:MAG: hypothetical protein ACI92G_003567 [Candidatus Pelagisphaera sp.]|jgi:hypothetical protein